MMSSILGGGPLAALLGGGQQQLGQFGGALRGATPPMTADLYETVEGLTYNLCVCHTRPPFPTSRSSHAHTLPFAPRPLATATCRALPRRTSAWT